MKIKNACHKLLLQIGLLCLLLFSPYSFVIAKENQQTPRMTKKSAQVDSQKVSQTKGNILFEGYFRVLRGNEQIGYIIQRFDQDAKTLNFRSTYLIKSQVEGNQVIESLKAEAKEDFTPIFYQYTSKVNEQTKTIDARFDKDTMTLVIEENGQKVTRNEKLPPRIFLSTFLSLLIKKQQANTGGYETGKSFSYQAIAEELASVTKGRVVVGEKAEWKGVPVFQVENVFGEDTFTSMVTAQGEGLSTFSPNHNISTEIVKTSQEALKGQNLPIAILKSLFGSVPKGEINPVSQGSNPS